MGGTYCIRDQERRPTLLSRLISKVKYRHYTRRITTTLHGLMYSQPGREAVFSTLATNSRYRKVELDKCNYNKIAFTFHHGPYRFSGIPLELKNVPETFQRALNVIFAVIGLQFALVKMEDKVVFSISALYNIGHARSKLRLLSGSRDTFKLKKCNLIAEAIDYQGYLIRYSSLELT